MCIKVRHCVLESAHTIFVYAKIESLKPAKMWLFCSVKTPKFVKTRAYHNLNSLPQRKDHHHLFKEGYFEGSLDQSQLRNGPPTGSFPEQSGQQIAATFSLPISLLKEMTPHIVNHTHICFSEILDVSPLSDLVQLPKHGQVNTTLGTPGFLPT